MPTAALAHTPISREPAGDERLDALVRRWAGMENWLSTVAPEVSAEQRHLDDGSAERAYWHHGYVSALQDVIRLLDARGRQPN